jgi:general secretion pathway protein I
MNRRGFALIELLAAFLVFAVGFAVMMELAASGLRQARTSAELTDAALWAQSKMDTIGIEEPVKEGSDSGEFDKKYRWELAITEWEPPSDASVFETTNLVDLYRIELIVIWGQGRGERSARFVTVRAIQPGLNP